MRRVLSSLVAVVVLSGCAGPMYVTSVPAYNNALDRVIAAIENDGYAFVDMNHDTRNELCHPVAHLEGDNHYSEWIPNEVVNVNTYNFADSTGRTMCFSVQFKARSNHQDGAVYYTEVVVAGCSASDRKDYERLCGEHSPVWVLDSIQKDMTVKP